MGRRDRERAAATGAQEAKVPSAEDNASSVASADESSAEPDVASLAGDVTGPSESNTVAQLSASLGAEPSPVDVKAPEVPEGEAAPDTGAAAEESADPGEPTTAMAAEPAAAETTAAEPAAPEPTKEPAAQEREQEQSDAIESPQEPSSVEGASEPQATGIRCRVTCDLWHNGAFFREGTEHVFPKEVVEGCPALSPISG